MVFLEWLFENKDGGQEFDVLGILGKVTCRPEEIKIFVKFCSLSI
jgi:hypothetical protein